MIIPKPFDDELLSSWLFRISRANYTRLSTITQKIFHMKNIHLKDIDLYDFSIIDLNKFREITHCKNISKHQLLQYNGFLEEKINIYGRKRWITPHQRSSKKGTFFGTHFCPECLKKYGYLKKEWRLMIVNICEEHQCFLHNHCPKCKKELKFPNLDYEQKIYECHNCKYDLSSIETIKVNIDSIHMQTQRKLLNILECGYYKMYHRYYYSIGLFYLLRIIIKNIMKSKNIKINYLESIEPKLLSYLIGYSVLLLEDFPNRLNRFYKKHQLSNSSRIFDKYRYKRNNIPAWFLSGIQYNTISTRWYF